MKYFLFLFILLATSCQTYTLEKLPADRLHFGNKGGVTGELREYVLLLDSGKLIFHDPFTDTYEKVGRIKKDRLVEIVAGTQKLQFGAKPNRPGNMNTIIALHDATGKSELQWGNPKDAPDAATQKFYEGLMATVKEIRKKD